MTDLANQSLAICNHLMLVALPDTWVDDWDDLEEVKQAEVNVPRDEIDTLN